MFEDLEAQASFRPANEDLIATLVGETRSARIGLGAEGIVVSNLVFGKDFLLGLGAQSVYVFPFAAIEQLELRPSGGQKPKRVELRLPEWLNRNGSNLRMILRLRHSSESLAARLVTCDTNWLLLEAHENMNQLIVGLKSVRLIELVPVDNFGGAS
jgi:hypothetical protein